MLSQFASNLLHFLQSECSRTGKTSVDYPTILAKSGFTDPDLLERALEQLEEEGFIDRRYISTVTLLNDQI